MGRKIDRAWVAGCFGLLAGIAAHNMGVPWWTEGVLWSRTGIGDACDIALLTALGLWHLSALTKAGD